MKLTLVGIVKIFQRIVPAKTIGGPIMIVQMAGQQAQLGVMNLVFFSAFLSISLGLFNLFPIPVLDGGQIWFLLAEAVRGRPLEPARAGDHPAGRPRAAACCSCSSPSTTTSPGSDREQGLVMGHHVVCRRTP